ncbi:MAG: dephospho-CoA kinase [Gammaproteobacteria bacterium]|nr:dephospho-CoA kinase [Gammaproteobacteria bacterium]MBU1624303.1 dephospho-CoA kinase [Gammaproteobacteria bacterium]MBU1981031.1 dephospho-CoA kinase [Gammaproteobacteria bacterium]
MKSCYGLTGGIGSGKSTVAKLFEALGARIVDTDEISHRLTAAGGLAIPAIQQAFGDSYITEDGALDRTVMRALVFSDLDAKQRLQAILHPMILGQAKSDALSPSEAAYTLVVVPLLFESGRYRDWLDSVIVVDCPEAQQIAHTLKRSALDESTVRSIMAQQMDRASRLQLADEIIMNNSSLEQLEARVSELHKSLSAR